MSLDRRQFVTRAAIGGLAFQVGGVVQLLTPRDARAAQAAFSVLSPAEIRAIEAVGEVLLPGARDAGIAHFVDHQLAATPSDCLLLLRYLDVAPPYVAFYQAVLAALDGAAREAHGRAFADLAAADAMALVAGLSRETPAGWVGPPSTFAYFVLRNDAVDVVYGTIEGFEKLGIPYMPHIVPLHPW